MKKIIPFFKKFFLLFLTFWLLAAPTAEATNIVTSSGAWYKDGATMKLNPSTLDVEVDDLTVNGNCVGCGSTGGAYDLNGEKLTIDADGDTSLTSDTDDQIDIEISGADDFQFVANIFKILSGSSIQTNDGTNGVAGGAGSAGDSLSFYTGAGGDGDDFGNGGSGGDVVFNTGAGGEAGANGFFVGSGGDFSIVFGQGGPEDKDFGFAGTGGGINWTMGTGGDGFGVSDVTGGTGGSFSAAGGSGGAGINNGSGGSGGTLQLSGGAGGNAGVGGNAGSGGAVYLTGGSAAFLNGVAGGTGGSIFLTSGQGSAVGGSAGASGNIQVTTNSGAFPFAGDVTGGNSGYIQIGTGTGQAGAGTGDGGGSGQLEFYTGPSGSSTATAGDVGYISFTTGTAGDNTDNGQAGAGGEITFSASNGGDSLSGNGIDNIGGAGGYITFTAGRSGNAANASNSNTGGAAGYVSFVTGDGYVTENGGNFSITTGTAQGTSGNGGDIIFDLGTGFGGGRDGVFRMTGADEQVRWKMQGAGNFVIQDSGSTASLFLDHNGTNAVISSSVGNVYFPEGIIFAEADQDVLNYYRNDTFSPTVTDGAVGTVPVYTTNTGRYTRVGNSIDIDVYLTGDGGAEGAGAGQLNIALPFNSNVSQPSGLFPCGYALNNATESILYCELGANDSTLALHYFNTISTTATFTAAEQNNATRTIRLKFSYEI